MFKQVVIILSAIIVLIFTTSSCSVSDEVVERDPENFSVGGASLETGLEINDDMEITVSSVTFGPNEQFYFYFNNNEPFEDKELLVQLIDSIDGRVLAETNNYQFYPEESTLTDMIWFGSPGMYKISISVDEELRAFQEVIIRE